MTFRPGTFTRGAFAAVVIAVACLAAPVAGAGAQAPDTTIDSGPSELTNDATPTLTFSSSDTMATFECRHHPTGGAPPAFAPCLTGVPLPPLGDGGWIFEVRAVVGGVFDPEPASRSFTVDTTEPVTMITSGPTGPTNDATPAFDFTSSEASSSFECRHYPTGGAQPAFAPCLTGVPLPLLGDGGWVFEVRAVDQAGNRDPTPESRAFAVDTASPGTMFVSAPAALSNDTTPDFAFSSPDAGATFECWLHPAGLGSPAFAPCASPQAPGPLGDGAYVFAVQAVDAAGNRGAPATHGFEIDTAPPQTTITGGPGDTTAATAVFLFSAPGAARFSCRLDGGGWQPCDSPVSYSPLSLGPHQFEVTAVDAAGNEDPTPAHHAWQVLRPGLVIPAAVKQATALAKELVQMRRALSRVRLRTLARRRTLLLKTYDALTAGTVEVRARARVRQGGRRRWIGVLAGEREVPGAGRHRVRAKVTKKGRGLARSRRKLPLELRLSFTDLAGRSLWATATVTLRR
jgi:hypothetical protein